MPERPAFKRGLTGSKEATATGRPEPATGSSIEPTLLLVGADDKFAPALRIALARHRMYVETASVQDVAETVVVTAPDLVLLVGEAARDGGSTVLAALGSSSSTAIAPVAILDDNTALDVRLKAFRHGAVAVIPRTASIDAIADEVARLAREIPERGGEALGTVGEATLSEFLNALGKELRSGILSLKTEADEAPVRLVLGSGRPLAEFMDEFVRRVRTHVVKAEPLQYEFDDRAGGTVQLFGADTDTLPGSVSGLRVALADSDPARADVIAQELRARGATVVVIDLSPSDLQFSRLRQIDPEVLLIGEQHLQGQGYALIRQMRRDTRLRWASLLVVRWEEVWSEQVAVPAIDRLTGALRALTEGDRALRDRVDSGESLDTRLEITGPARCLRAIATSGRSLRVTVFNPRIRIAIDLSEGLVAGATAEPVGSDIVKDDAQWDGTSALSALLVLSSGRVHVDPVQTPAATNVMATLDVALSLADLETPPIEPSIPATTGSTYPPPADSVSTVNVPRASATGPSTGMSWSAGVESTQPPSAPPEQQERAAPYVPVGLTPALAFPAPSASAPAPAPTPPPPPPALAGEDPFAAVPAPPSVRSERADVAAAEAAPAVAAETATASGAWATPQVADPPASTPPGSPYALKLPPSLVPRGKGISTPVAALLVALAALQGVLIVVTYWWLTRDTPTVTSTASTSTGAPKRAASPAPQPTGPEPPSVTPGSAAPTVAPAPATSAAEPAPLGVDESGKRAPSCDELLKSVSALDGDFPGAAYEQQILAERALVRGDVDEAQLCYCKAARWDKTSPGRFIDLAQLALIRRDGARAAEFARQALTLSPGNTKAYGLLGDGLARTGDISGATEAWFASIGVEATPLQKAEFVRKSLHEATMSKNKRDWPRAERFFRRVILVDPENLKAALGLANALVQLGEPKPAIRWAQRALVIDPRSAAARVVLGDAHAAAGDDAAAEYEWRDALALDAKNAEALQRLARAGKLK